MGDIGALAGLAKKPEVLGAVVGAVITAVLTALGWIFVTIYARRSERAKEEAELHRARARRALAACESLRYLLDNWLDQIDEATKYEASTENTLTKLRRFQVRKFFKTRLDECKDALRAAARDEPGCDRLLNLTGLFHPKMFEIKGQLEMALTFAAGNYHAHREQARRAIEREYNELTRELEKVIDDLSKKVALENYSPPKHFLPKMERPGE